MEKINEVLKIASKLDERLMQFYEAKEAKLDNDRVFNLGETAILYALKKKAKELGFEMPDVEVDADSYWFYGKLFCREVYNTAGESWNVADSDIMSASTYMYDGLFHSTGTDYGNHVFGDLGEDPEECYCSDEDLGDDDMDDEVDEETLEIIHDMCMDMVEMAGPVLLPRFDNLPIYKKISELTDEEKMDIAKGFYNYYEYEKNSSLKDLEGYPKARDVYEKSLYFNENDFIDEMDEFGFINRGTGFDIPLIYLSLIIHNVEDSVFYGNYVSDLVWHRDLDAGKIINKYNKNPEKFPECEDFVRALLTGGNGYADTYVNENGEFMCFMMDSYSNRGNLGWGTGPEDNLEQSVSLEFYVAIHLVKEVLGYMERKESNSEERRCS